MGYKEELAIAIIDIFESMLDKKDITIPDEFREDEEGEARIFGETYYDLESQIVSLLEKETIIIKPLRFGVVKNEYNISSKIS